MTEVDLNQEETEEFTAPDEYSTLKARAELLGLKFPKNISLEALREKVNAKLTPIEVEVKAPNMALRDSIIAEATRKLRVRITNMNPKKAGLKGEIFTVGNKYFGTIKEWVPYITRPEGWHISNVVYKQLQKRTFTHLTEVKVKGVETQVSSTVKEFAIEILPQLSQKELDNLAIAQRTVNNI